MDADQGEDQDRHFEHDAHAEDERRDEGEVLGRAQLILDDRVAEADEELQRAREQAEVAEKHARDEQEEHERPGGQCETPLVGVQCRIDIGVDLEEDHADPNWDQVGEMVIVTASGCWRVVPTSATVTVSGHRSPALTSWTPGCPVHGAA